MMDEEHARALVARVKMDLGEVENSLRTLYEQQAWLVLGYPSWVEMCQKEFASLRELGRATRAALVAGLSDAGMSIRAQAGALGVGRTTVQRDMARNGTGSDAVVIGMDGKRYPPRETPDPALPPIPDRKALRVTFPMPVYARLANRSHAAQLEPSEYVAALVARHLDAP